MSGTKQSNELKVSITFAKIAIHINENIRFIGNANIQRIIEAMNPYAGIIIKNGKVIAAIINLISGKKAKKALKFAKQKKYYETDHIVFESPTIG